MLVPASDTSFRERCGNDLYASSLILSAPSLPKSFSPMANWYYYNESGEKVGPITPTALKTLVMQGLITPETVIENNTGRSCAAGKVNGLTFPNVTVPPDEVGFGPDDKEEVYGLASSETKIPPPAEPNPFTAAPSVTANPFNSSPSFPITQSPFTQQAPMPMAAFCTNCGQPVNPAAAACLACGANPKGHKRFCGNCGVPISEVQVICIKCGAAVASHPQSQGGGNAFLDIFALKPDAPLKSRTAYVCIALFLFGGIGMHNFYAGRVKVAFLQLVIGLLGLIIFAVPTLVVWIWAVLDCIQVKEDGLGRPMV
jgi:TM2 domain-containing membrane protein YozV